MAARTFTSAGVNNLWSNVANWDGGATIPQEDDSVTIPSGQTCEYDYNSAYTTGIAGITVTGTLSLTRTAGTYRLFMKAATTIAGAGTFDCGTSVSPIPIAAKHTITGGSAWYVNGSGGLTLTIKGTAPTIVHAKLTAVETIGSTVLDIDTDVTGVWSDGDSVIIADKQLTADTEIRTIAVGGITANTITITEGLTAQKQDGAYIFLHKRNVSFIGNGADLFKSFQEAKLVFYEGLIHTVTGHTLCQQCTAVIVNGGLFTTTNNGNMLNIGDRPTINDGIFIRGTAINSGMGATVNGGNFYGVLGIIASSGGCSLLDFNIFGSTRIIHYCYATVISGGTGDYISDAISYSQATIMNMELTNATYMLHTSSALLYNVGWGGSGVAFFSKFSEMTYAESFDHNQVAGAYSAWTAGGVTTKQTTTKPTGQSYSMQTVLGSATKEGYFQKEVTISAGASVDMDLYLRKSASMTYLPRILIFNKADTDPFAGGTPLKTFTMTDSTDTWEDDTYTYTNSTSEDITLIIRCQGMNATGNMYSLVTIDVINVDLTSALSKLDTIDTVVDAIKAKTDTLKNPSLLIDGEIII